MKKFDVTLDLYGKKFKFHNVEAETKEIAVMKAKNQAVAKLMLFEVVVSPVVDKSSNAKPISGEEMFEKFFGKFRSN